MTPAEPLVSVVMTVRDGEAHLGEALRSIQAQSYRHWELLVVDDGSRDGSAAVVEALAARDRRIRLLAAPRRGRAVAANIGVAHAKGELLARLDADDIAVPERLAVQVRWIEQAGVDLCGGWAMRFGDSTGLWWVPEKHEAIARELLVGFPLVNSTTLARTELMRANLYDERWACEDQELWARLALSHRLGNVPAVLARYRCHPGQVTRREAARLRADHRICRAQLFAAMFPDAQPGHADALNRVAEGEKCSSLEELANAGAALARLARHVDPLVRRRMMGRWHRVCRQSVDLGPSVGRVYRQVAPAFESSIGAAVGPSAGATAGTSTGATVGSRFAPRAVGAR